MLRKNHRDQHFLMTANTKTLMLSVLSQTLQLPPVQTVARHFKQFFENKVKRISGRISLHFIMSVIGLGRLSMKVVLICDPS